MDMQNSNEELQAVKFIDDLLNEAVIKQASDIHLEPNEGFYRIRYRIDGLLYESSKIESSLGMRCSSRLMFFGTPFFPGRQLLKSSVSWKHSSIPSLYGRTA